MSDSVISLSDFKAGASQWLKQLQDDNQAVVLTQNGRGSAVVQSFDSFQRQQQSLAMLKLMTQGEADVQAGRLGGQSETFAKVRKQLEKRRG
jgi:prevent-host-death family protein